MTPSHTLSDECLINSPRMAVSWRPCSGSARAHLGRAVPQVGNHAVGITRDEGLDLARLGHVDVAPHCADVGAVDVDADRGAVGEGVRYRVDVADGRGDGIDAARFDEVLAGLAHRLLAAGALEFLAFLRAAHYADQAPDRMIVYRSGVPGSPDEAHHRKALERVAVEQVLAVGVGVG